MVGETRGGEGGPGGRGSCIASMQQLHHEAHGKMRAQCRLGLKLRVCLAGSAALLPGTCSMCDMVHPMHAMPWLKHGDSYASQTSMRCLSHVSCPSSPVQRRFATHIEGRNGVGEVGGLQGCLEGGQAHGFEPLLHADKLCGGLGGRNNCGGEEYGAAVRRRHESTPNKRNA